jgi:uncharacterized protein (TIGR03067 family)
VALLACLLIAAADPCPEPTEDGKADLKKMQGTWKVTKLEEGGRAVDASKIGTRIIVSKDKLTIKDKNRDEVVTFQLNAKKKPREIDLVPLRPNGKPDDMVPGIYKLEKDTLTICFGKGDKAPRPKGFDTKERGVSVLVMQRVKE